MIDPESEVPIIAATSSPDLLTQVNIARLNQYYEMAGFRIKAVTDLAMLWLKSMTILSGGAIIGLLTLVGSGKVSSINQVELWWSFVLFVSALVLTMSSLFFGYSGQDRYYQVELLQAENLYSQVTGKEGSHSTSRDASIGTGFTLTAIALAASALICFAAGGGFALKAAVLMKPAPEVSPSATVTRVPTSAAPLSASPPAVPK